MKPGTSKLKPPGWGEAQSAKALPYKHKDLSSVLRNHVKGVHYELRYEDWESKVGKLG